MSWEAVRLDKVCIFLNGGTPSRQVDKFFEGNIPWITSADISEDQDIVSEARFYITQEAVDSSATKLIPKGNILLVSRTGVGKIAITGTDICISQDFTGIIPNKEVVNLRYLFRFLQSKKDYFVSHQRGATIQGITRKVISDLELPLPPLEQQRRIAAILDQADRLRTLRREALAKLDRLLQATFLDMFGDPVTNPLGWEVKKFEETGTLERGKSKHRPRNDPVLLGGSYPLIQTGEVTNAAGGYLTEYSQTYSELGLKQSKMWKAGVLCITIAANIAQTAILTFDACFPDSIVGFTPNRDITIEYVQYWLQFLREIIEEKAPQVAQKNINLKILRELEIPVPPIHLQNTFSDAVVQYTKQRQHYQQSLTQLDNLFNSLQQRAFRGELSERSVV